jgi:hypothetical protein
LINTSRNITLHKAILQIVTNRFKGVVRLYPNKTFVLSFLGYCFSYEYSCGNGRCISNSLTCNGYNPCGDYSDCAVVLTVGGIAGIVVGGIFFVVIVIILAVVLRRRRMGYVSIVSRQDAPFLSKHFCSIYSFCICCRTFSRCIRLPKDVSLHPLRKLVILKLQ